MFDNRHDEVSGDEGNQKSSSADSLVDNSRSDICDLKPLFEVGDEVYAAWWDDAERTGESQ